MNILIVVAGLILVIIGGLIGVIILTTQPTHGNKIAQYESPQKALLVIDIQEDYTGTTAQPPFPYKESEKLIATVNKIIEAASDNILIVYIRQEFDGVWGRMLSKVFARGTGMRGNPGTEIDKRIAIRSSHFLSKPKGDAFSNPKLDELLIEHQVNEVYLVGLDAEFCIHHTAKGALNRGYTVNIIKDGIALRAKKKWGKLLEKYQQEGIRLMLSQEFITGSPRASAREDYR